MQVSIDVMNNDVRPSLFLDNDCSSGVKSIPMYDINGEIISPTPYVTHIERYLLDAGTNTNYFFGTNASTDNNICIITTANNGAFVFNETNQTCHQLNLYTENNGKQIPHYPTEIHVLGYSSEFVYCYIEGDVKKWYITYPKSAINNRCPSMYPSKYISNLNSEYIYTDILNLPIMGYVCFKDIIKRFKHHIDKVNRYAITYNHCINTSNEIILDSSNLNGNSCLQLKNPVIANSMTTYSISNTEVYKSPTENTPVITTAIIGAYGPEIDNSHAGFSIVFGGKGVIGFSRQPNNNTLPKTLYYIPIGTSIVHMLVEITINGQKWVFAAIDNGMRLYRYDTTNDTIIEWTPFTNLYSPMMGIINYNRDNSTHMFISTRKALIYTTDMTTYSIIKEAEDDEEFTLLTQVRLDKTNWSTDSWIILASTKRLYIFMATDPAISCIYSTEFKPIVCDGESGRTLLFGGSCGLYTFIRFPGIYMNLPIHSPTIDEIHKRVITLEEKLQALTNTVNQMAEVLNSLAYNCQHITKVA